MSATPPQIFAKIFALFMSGAIEGERKAAERKMDQWLARHGKTRADIPSILVQAAKDDRAAQPPPPPSDPRDAGTAGPIGANITPLDLIRALLQDYIAIDEHEYIALALWSVHTHVYDRFEHTPRLVATSPVRHCGKTTVLKVLSRLVARPEPIISITQGALYDTINRLPHNAAR